MTLIDTDTGDEIPSQDLERNIHSDNNDNVDNTSDDEARRRRVQRREEKKEIVTQLLHQNQQGIATSLSKTELIKVSAALNGSSNSNRQRHQNVDNSNNYNVNQQQHQQNQQTQQQNDKQQQFQQQQQQQQQEQGYPLPTRNRLPKKRIVGGKKVHQTGKPGSLYMSRASSSSSMMYTIDEFYDDDISIASDYIDGTNKSSIHSTNSPANQQQQQQRAHSAGHISELQDSFSNGFKAFANTLLSSAWTSTSTSTDARVPDSTNDGNNGSNGSGSVRSNVNRAVYDNYSFELPISDDDNFDQNHAYDPYTTRDIGKNNDGSGRTQNTIVLDDDDDDNNSLCDISLDSNTGGSSDGINEDDSIMKRKPKKNKLSSTRRLYCKILSIISILMILFVAIGGTFLWYKGQKQQKQYDGAVVSNPGIVTTSIAATPVATPVNTFIDGITGAVPTVGSIGTGNGNTTGTATTTGTTPSTPIPVGPASIASTSTTQAINANDMSIYINCGSQFEETYDTNTNIHWLPDYSFIKNKTSAGLFREYNNCPNKIITTKYSNVYSASTNITLDTISKLYCSERWFKNTIGQYEIPLASSSTTTTMYTVVLHFVEVYFAQKDARKFTIRIENQTSRESFDILEQAMIDVNDTTNSNHNISMPLARRYVLEQQQEENGNQRQLSSFNLTSYISTGIAGGGRSTSTNVATPPEKVARSGTTTTTIDDDHRNGRHSTVLLRFDNVSVTDGLLNIDLVPMKDNPKINAIEIHPIIYN